MPGPGAVAGVWAVAGGWGIWLGLWLGWGGMGWLGNVVSCRAGCAGLCRLAWLGLARLSWLADWPGMLFGPLLAGPYYDVLCWTGLGHPPTHPPIYMPA